MSDIQLSPQLFQDIQKSILKHDPDADQGLILQYLAAVMGYMLGSQQTMNDSERQQYMSDLCEFAHQVFHDMSQKQQQQEQMAAANAFGYWNPPKS